MLSLCASLLLTFVGGFQWDKVPLHDKFLPRRQPADKITNGPDDDLECKMRTLAYQFGQNIQSFRGAQQKTYDALNLDHYCGSSATSNTPRPPADSVYHVNAALVDDASVYTVYVDPIHGDDANAGTIALPFGSLDQGLRSTRAQHSNELVKQIVVRQGTLFLTQRIVLSPATFDSNLRIRAYPAENETLSGGVLLNSTQLAWQRYDDGNASHNIWMTKVDASRLFNGTILSLFTLEPHTRLTRARFPNGHVDVFNEGAYYINPYLVNTWWTQPADVSRRPKQVFKNLSDCNTTQPCLPYSSNAPYNTFTLRKAVYF